MGDAASDAANSGQTVYCGDHVVLTRLPNGRLIYLDMRDASVAARLALGLDHEFHVGQALRAVAKPGDTFLDVGANVGYHSLMLWDVLAQGGGAMHLFEPNPVMHALIRRTLQANGIWTNAHSACVALSDSRGSATLTVYEDQWASARLQDPDELARCQHPWATTAVVREQFEVTTTTLDDYCEECRIDRVDLMKIDVEGHEDAVFAGMQETLRRSPTMSIVMEFTFGAYDDAPGFWSALGECFPYRFRIEQSCELRPVDTYEHLCAGVSTELTDVLLCRVWPTPS
jgi:FkbM family methyltransferase